MKNIFKIKPIIALSLLLITFIACDRDFTSIESDIEGIKNFENKSKTLPVVAYNKKINPVQTNGLSSNLLGVYFDQIYGKTVASVVTQVVPVTFGTSFPENAEISSVILSIPYYSNRTETNSEGNSLYELDSLFGSETVKLSIYQNNYFLRDFDPETDLLESQKFYSNANQTINFDNHLGELFYENNVYFPNEDEILIEEINDEGGVDIIERIPPSLRVELLNTADFWDNLFFSLPENAPELSNQNNFKDYFRGLYFKIEDTNNNGHMMMMDFSQGYIEANYTWIETTTDENGEDIEVTKESLIRLNLTGNRLNILENDPTNTTINVADANANITEGDETLYLKGGEGAMTVIDLFNGETIDENGSNVNAFDYFKSKKESWLINEANLTFYVNQSIVQGQEPDRVILYDLNNNVPIVDFFFDGSVNNSNPINSKTGFSRKLEYDENEEGVKYKFRLTEHLNNVLLKDSTNVKLGLLITTNINLIQNADILDSDEEFIFTGAVLSPRGTALYGTNPNVPIDKKVKFEIFYTEPNN